MHLHRTEAARAVAKVYDTQMVSFRIGSLQTVVARSWWMAYSLAFASACGANESPFSPSAAGEIAATEQPLDSKLDSSERAQRYERFRSQLEARLGRGHGDLEQQRQTATVTRVPLQRRFGHATAARRMPDGRIQYGCFDHAESAAQFLANPSAEVQP